MFNNGDSCKDLSINLRLNPVMPASRPITREVVDAFYRAMIDRDPVRLDRYLDDSVTWTISGPVEALPFCGRHVGKVATMDVIMRLVPSVLATRDFVIDMQLVDGDCASVLARLRGTHPCGRMISYRISHFMRFRGEKVVEFMAVLDSFDAAEQISGHHFGLPKHDAPATSDDIVAL